MYLHYLLDELRTPLFIGPKYRSACITFLGELRTLLSVGILDLPFLLDELGTSLLTSVVDQGPVVQS